MRFNLRRDRMIDQAGDPNYLGIFRGPKCSELQNFPESQQTDIASPN